jgi:uncharacterized protein YjbJ (UPF0337 family)
MVRPQRSDDFNDVSLFHQIEIDQVNLTFYSKPFQTMEADNLAGCGVSTDRDARMNSKRRIALLSHHSRKGMRHMDKDRIKGSAQQLKGKVKEVAGKATGDAKLEAEGKVEKAEGKVRNAIGGAKDTLKGK